MAENVGQNDRIVRIIGGFILILMLMFEKNNIKTQIIGIFAIYGVMTGSLGTCFVYSLLNIRTNKKKS